VVASSDLHGLGATDGAPIAFTWTPPSLVLRFLPWMALLLLLTLKNNRTGSAWWIWVPVLGVAGLSYWVGPLLDFIPSDALSALLNALEALAVGLAAVWLLAGHFQRRLRLVIFLQMLAVMAILGSVAFLLRSDWEKPFEVLGFLVFLGALSLVLTAALSLSGWVCRGRYRPGGLTLWFIVVCGVLWSLVVTPFILAALMTGDAGWVEFAQVVLFLAGITLGIALPFLVLSFVNGFYRDRLRGLLRIKDAEADRSTVDSL